MPQKNIVEFSVEIEDDQMKWLKKMTENFDLRDDSKSLRVLLDFAMQDADEETIFSRDNMRCRHCV